MVEVSLEAFPSDSFLTETPQRDFLSESTDPVKAAEGSRRQWVVFRCCSSEVMLFNLRAQFQPLFVSLLVRGSSLHENLRLSLQQKLKR